MAKLTLTDIASGYGSRTALNANNAAIETAVDNTLSRDGTSPNAMAANLDMGGYRLLNVGGFTIGDVDEYADDSAAATGGVVVGGLYRTGSALKIRTA